MVFGWIVKRIFFSLVGTSNRKCIARAELIAENRGTTFRRAINGAARRDSREGERASAQLQQHVIPVSKH